MPFDLYPAVDEDFKFAQAVREANALTPEFRNQVVPLTETQRNNLSGDELWDDRLVYNTTKNRINRYDAGSAAWFDLSSEAPGIVKMYAAATAPDGHMLCDGALISRTGIGAALFSVIGTQFNIGGEPSTHFRLPNLKGKVVVGVDAAQSEFNVLGEFGGEKTHTLTEAETPSHDHAGTTGDDGPDHAHANTITDGAGTHAHQLDTNQIVPGTLGGGGGSLVREGFVSSGGRVTGPAGGHNHGINNVGASARHQHGFTTDSAGGNGAHNNLQPYLVMNYIITL